MKAAIALGLATCVVIVTRPVDARPCGHSGGRSGGRSHGHASKACVETSEVLGRRTCSRFGSWARRFPLPITVETGTAVTSVDLGGFDRTGTIDHDGARFAYRAQTDDAADSATAIVGIARLILGGRLYIGEEWQVGGLAGAPRVTITQEPVDGYAPTLTGKPSIVMQGAAVVGARARIGSFGFGAELVGGVRMIGVAVDSKLGACETTTSNAEFSAVLETRLRGEYWLTPRLSVGVFGGRDITADDSRSIGVFVGGSVSPFGGVR